MTRVLVVEDDRQTAEEIAAALGDHGFDVDGAETGREGLLKAAAGSYDAIVLDRMLPGGLDGLGVLSTLRTAGVDAPVLILSALSAQAGWTAWACCPRCAPPGWMHRC